MPASFLILYYSQVLAVAGLNYRFFYPYLFPFLVASGNEFANLSSYLENKLSKHFQLLMVSFLLIYLSLGPFFYESRNIITLLRDDLSYDENTDNYMRIGKALRSIETSEPIGIGEVGKIGYMLRDYTVVDIVGLNDPYLARHSFSMDYLREREVNILIIFEYPRAPLGVYADVYRKIGDNFEALENEFLCVGNIRGLDVFVRKEPLEISQKFINWLIISNDFDEGICLSHTTSRWSPKIVSLPIEDWGYSDIELNGDDEELQFTPTGNDPIFRSPQLNLSAEDYRNFVVTMILPPPIECSTFTLYFTRTDAPVESEERAMYVPYLPSDQPQSIIANVQIHPEWRGTIHTLRFDPVCGLNSDGTLVRFDVLDIKLQ